MNKNGFVNHRSLKSSLKEGVFKELEIEKKENLQWGAVKYLCCYEHCTSDEAKKAIMTRWIRIGVIPRMSAAKTL